MKSNEIAILNHHSISITSTARCQQRHVDQDLPLDGVVPGEGWWRRSLKDYAQRLTTHSAFASRSRYTWKVRRLAGDAKSSSKDQTTGWWWLEPWNFMTFPSYWEWSSQLTFTPWFFRGVAKNHQPVHIRDEPRSWGSRGAWILPGLHRRMDGEWMARISTETEDFVVRFLMNIYIY